MEQKSENSPDTAFKLPKYKMEVRPGVLQAIKFHASVNMDGLFDKNFSEEEQGGGYHGFKQLVLLQNPIPADYGDYAHGQPGYYLLQRLHPLVRQRAIDCARDIRKTFNIFKDA